MVTILPSSSLKNSQKDTFYLAPLRKEDVAERYVSWLNDPEINRYLEIRHAVPITQEDVIAFVEKCLFDRRPHWGIFDGKKHIGNVSCSAYDLRSRWIDISFLLGEKDYWGKGICTDAIASVLDYLFNEQLFHKVCGGTYSINKGSIRIFEKLGFAQEACFREQALLDGGYVDVFKFGLLKKDWFSNKNDWARLKVYPLSWSFFLK